MKRIGIFVDVSNLFYCCSKKFNGKKIDYKKFYDFCRDLGEIQVAVAYGAALADEAKGFIHALKAIGFETKWKVPKTYNNNPADPSELRRKCDNDVDIAMGIVNMSANLDIIILGSADWDMKPCVDWVKNKGLQVVVLACGISRDLRDTATKSIEIPESLLEERKEKAKDETKQQVCEQK